MGSLIWHWHKHHLRDYFRSQIWNLLEEKGDAFMFILAKGKPNQYSYKSAFSRIIFIPFAIIDMHNHLDRTEKVFLEIEKLLWNFLVLNIGIVSHFLSEKEQSISIFSNKPMCVNFHICKRDDWPGAMEGINREFYK